MAQKARFRTSSFLYAIHLYKEKKPRSVFRRDTFPGTWFDVQPGGCYDKQNLDNATCASSMGCAKSQDWLPTDVAVYANMVVLSHLYTNATFLPR